MRERSRLVLFVEDDPDVRALYAEALREGGLIVDEVDNAEEAMAVAKHLRPDAIILDRHLPDGDGWDIARTLRKNPDTAGVAIVAFTRLLQRADVENALVAGCDVFIDKPCDPLTLVNRLKGLVDLPIDDVISRSS